MARPVPLPGKRSVCLLLVIYSTCFILLNRSAPGESATANKATVIIDATKITGRFDPNLLGHNIQWTEQGDGLLAPQTIQNSLFRPNVIEALKQLPVPLIRFPGGALASSYIWQKGVGPLGTRGSCPDFVGKDQPMLFGTMEYLALLRELGANGMVTLNINREPEEAAEWLRFVRQAGGAVSYWEVGNESFLPKDPSYSTVDTYISRYFALRKALKAVDPDIKVGPLLEGSLIGTTWGSLIVPELEVWNRRVVEAINGQAEFFAAHFYAPLARADSEVATATAMAAASEAMERNLRTVSTLIRRQRPDQELWVTEFNVLTDNALANWRFGTALAQANYVSSLLLAFVRQQVAGANFWSLLGNHNFGLIKSSQDPRLRPAALVYQLMGPVAGALAIATETNAPELAYPVIGNVPQALAPKVIDAQAFVKGEDLQVMLVNRDPLQPLEVTLNLPPEASLAAGSGALLISGPSFLANNEASDQVRLSDLPLQSPTSNQVVLALPPMGIARLWVKCTKCYLNLRLLR
jgi:alpha-L-arabinofuranosidase